jgi:hypothetical protein
MSVAEALEFLNPYFPSLKLLSLVLGLIKKWDEKLFIDPGYKGSPGSNRYKFMAEPSDLNYEDPYEVQVYVDDSLEEFVAGFKDDFSEFNDTELSPDETDFALEYLATQIDGPITLESVAKHLKDSGYSIVYEIFNDGQSIVYMLGFRE